MSERGFFLSFEGGDGVGKTVQSDALQQLLEGKGFDVVRTREPGGTELGAEIRQLLLHRKGYMAPKAEALLYAADRAHNIETVVRPALAEGKVVIQDRYLDSSVAYQGAGRVLGADEVRDLSLWATDGLLPDLTILLDLDPEVGLARVRNSREGFDRLESEKLEFHVRVRNHYLALATAEPERFLVIDAEQDPKVIAAHISERVLALFQS